MSHSCEHVLMGILEIISCERKTHSKCGLHRPKNWGPREDKKKGKECCFYTISPFLHFLAHYHLNCFALLPTTCMTIRTHRNPELKIKTKQNNTKKKTPKTTTKNCHLLISLIFYCQINACMIYFWFLPPQD